MADLVQLTIPYTYMNLDDQPQIVLGGSIVSVPAAAAHPTATVLNKGGGTLTAQGNPASSKGGAKTR